MHTPCEVFIAKLTGAWSGAGLMQFPTLQAQVNYDVRLTFEQPTEKTRVPFTKTSQSSWKAGTDRAMGMHYDSGFLKCTSPTSMHWTLAHNFGVGEVLEGTVSEDGKKAVFESQALANATETKGTRREYEISGDGDRNLLERFYMKTEHVPEMTLHLTASYKKE
eukprot:PhM_4_TR17907/c0_g1_i1/m.64795